MLSLPIRSPRPESSRSKTLSATRIDAHSVLTALDAELAGHFESVTARGIELQSVLHLEDYPGNVALVVISQNRPRLHPAVAQAAINLHTSCDNLKEHVMRLHRESSPETFAKTMSGISTSLLRLAEAGNIDEQRAVVLVLDAIVAHVLPLIVEDVTVVKLTSCIRIVISVQASREDQGELLTLTTAARALGRLARVSDPAFRVDFTKFEAERALEWLELAVHASKRLAACLILRHLCDTDTTALIISKDNIVLFFDRVEPSLMGHSATTRVAACDALEAFLALVDSRDEMERCFRRCYNIVHRGIERIGTPSAIHGALLTVAVLFRKRNELIQNVYTDLCQEILRFRTHQDPRVVRQVAIIIPDLASYSARFYQTPHLQVSLDFLLHCSRSSSPLALIKSGFDSLSQLVKLLPASALEPDLVRIADVILDALRVKDSAPYALACISSIAKVPRLANELCQLKPRKFLVLLDAMFACPGLLPELIESLQTFSSSLESGWKALLAARLVHSVAIKITRRPFTPGEDEHADLVRALQPSAYAADLDVAAGLSALQRFNFGSINLVHFLHEHVRPLMEADKPEIRIQAAETCSSVLVSTLPHLLQSVKLHAEAALIVEDMLSRALVDPSDVVRARIMACLNHPNNFGVYLAQVPHLKLLVLALNDKAFAVRLEGTRVATSVAHLNPVYVLPALRKMTISWILDLRSKTASPGSKEEVALVLAELVSGLVRSPGTSSRYLLGPLIGPLMLTLIQEVDKAASSDAGARAETTMALLHALAACGGIDDPRARAWMKEAVPPVVSLIGDTSHAKRCEAAVTALYSLVRGAGLVSEAVSANPHLLDTLLGIIAQGALMPWSLESQVLRLLGFFGAIDPLKVRTKYTRRVFTAPSDSFDMTIKAAVGSRHVSKSPHPDETSLAEAHEGGGGNGGGINGISHGNGTGLAGLVHVDSSLPAALLATGAGLDDDDSSISSSESLDSNDEARVETAAEFGSSTIEQLEEYIRTVAITTLTRILKMPSLSFFFGYVIEAAGNTCRSLGMSILPFVPRLVPAILAVGLSPRCESELVRLCVKQVTVFVSMLRRHIRPYLDRIFALALKRWDEHALEGLELVEEAAYALKEEFVPHLPWVVPRVVLALRGGSSGHGHATNTTLQERHKAESACLAALSATLALARFAPAVHMHRVVVEIVSLMEESKDTAMRIKVMETIVKLAPFASFQPDASRAVLALVAVLRQGDAKLVPVSVEAISAVLQEGDDSLLRFISDVPEQHRKRLIREAQEYQSAPSSPLSNADSVEAPGGNMTLSMALGEHLVQSKLPAVSQDAYVVPLAAHKHSKDVWQVRQATSEEDWSLWLRRLSVELLRDSPDATLRACASIAQTHQPLARDLFNAAFLSCWIRLSDEECNQLVQVVKSALRHPSTPPDVLHALLNLAEFMDHHNRALPIDVHEMAAFAVRCQAYAKALRYKEIEFSSHPAQCLDDLIALNHQLERHEAAAGLLRLARGTPYSRRIGLDKAVPVKEVWFERLGRWRDALESYERKVEHASDTERFELVLGSMRCLASLGEYTRLTEVGLGVWQQSDNETERRLVAPLLAHGLWAQGLWSDMEPYVDVVDHSDVNGSLLRAVSFIAQGPRHFAQALDRVEQARRMLSSDLSTLLTESYGSAYHRMVHLQQLLELEEIVAVKSRPDYQEDFEASSLVKRWSSRLAVCQESVTVWQQILSVRLLMRRPEDDEVCYVKFVNICRREERWGLGRSTLARIGVNVDYPIASLRSGTASPLAVYALCKLVWAGASDKPPAGDRGVAVRWLQQLIEEGFAGARDIRLAVKLRLQLGEWLLVLDPERASNTALKMVEEGKRLDPSNYKANHSWALLNFHAFETKRSSVVHLVEAIRGFFYAIALGRGSISTSSSSASTGSLMQDLLRLMTLWLDQASAFPAALDALREGFQSRRIPVSTWLNVVPQLIARIHNDPPFLRELLVELGNNYPQALVYPLTVAARSVDPRVRSAGESILVELRQKQSELLDQAALVARELIRVAILLPEEWYEALEDACKAWYPLPSNEGETRTPENVRLRLKALRAMNDILNDLNQRLSEQYASTRHEGEFYRRFGKSLERAYNLVKLYEERRGYEQPGKNKHMQEAWVEYKRVYYEIGDKYFKELGTLDLDDISPRLLQQRNLELAVPGTFKVDDELVTIVKFSPRVKVFATKQRPRQIGIIGSDGCAYKYLLKGHEDLRQDERAMQLFGMVNALLSKTAATARGDMTIQQYIVIPLSNNVGIIGWLPHTDTFHSLVRRYRSEKHIVLNLEQQLANKVSPAHDSGSRGGVDPNGPGNLEGYERLTLMQKVEAFEWALQKTDGDDLKQVMWLKSQNAEVWLERRTTFTRSLSTMSMVGYILGLGDRHPSNLMLDRYSGKVVHIDFGDCFEVAIYRDKFPERVPFRLTRMLVNAMEVSGIEGNFRWACEAVMMVLRDNRDSVMAMLEAFVHDPLISWRLCQTTSPPPESLPPLKGGNTLDTVEEEPVLASGHHHSDAEHSDAEMHSPALMPVDMIGAASLSRAVPIRLRKATMDETEVEAEDMAQSFHVGRERSRRYARIDDKDVALNKQAVKVIRRVRDKLGGMDFGDNEPLSVQEQVDKLIKQAIASESLAVAFSGWCAFW